MLWLEGQCAIVVNEDKLLGVGVNGMKLTQIPCNKLSKCCFARAHVSQHKNGRGIVCFKSKLIPSMIYQPIQSLLQILNEVGNSCVVRGI